MTDKLRVPDTVYGRHGYWTAQGNRAIFLCDDGLELHFVMPQGTKAHAGLLDDVVAHMDELLKIGQMV